MTSALISPAELNIVLGQDGLVVLDASYGLPPSGEGIPGAVDFDIDDIADPEAKLPHTVPPPELFAQKVGALGIGNGDAVVIYDRAGIHMAACRAWWMFRLFGHDNVRVLDGGLPAWKKAGLRLSASKGRPGPAKPFKSKFRPELLKTRDQMLENLTKKGFTVLDARSPGRFDGSEPEPREGVASGHIPDSCNVPFAAILDPETGRVRPRAELQSFLGDKSNISLACTCGSGVTACVVALGLYEVGVTNAAVYDGSWTEWGGDPDLPKAVGA